MEFHFFHFNWKENHVQEKQLYNIFSLRLVAMEFPDNQRFELEGNNPDIQPEVHYFPQN